MFEKPCFEERLKIFELKDGLHKAIQHVNSLKAEVDGGRITADFALNEVKKRLVELLRAYS